jgi:hypothetical protein
MEHSLTSDTASAWEPRPWRAVQVAAWDVLTKAECARGGYDSSARRSSFQTM